MLRVIDVVYKVDGKVDDIDVNKQMTYVDVVCIYGYSRKIEPSCILNWIRTRSSTTDYSSVFVI